MKIHSLVLMLHALQSQEALPFTPQFEKLSDKFSLENGTLANPQTNFPRKKSDFFREEP